MSIKFVNSQEFHILMVILLLAVTTACDYYKIPLNQQMLMAVMLALNISPRPPQV